MYVPKKGYTNFTISKVDIMCLCVCVCAAGMQIFKCVSVCVCNGSGKFGGRDYGSDARPLYTLYCVCVITSGHT